MANKQVGLRFKMVDFKDFHCDEYYDKDYISIEEYMKTSEPVPDENIRIPKEFDIPITEPTDFVKDGEISRLLRNTPNILPPVDNFGKNYVPPKPVKQPEVIFTDKIPIFLDAKYFKFNKSNEEQLNENVNKKVNEKVNKKVNETQKGKSSWISFSDDDDEDNNDDTKAAELIQRCQIDEHETKETKEKPKKPVQRYYNPFEVYMMKRGNQKSNKTTIQSK